MEIKKGDKFKCIRPVEDIKGNVIYVYGRIYESDRDGCIINEQGIEEQWENDVVDPLFTVDDYFVKLDSSQEVKSIGNNVNHPPHYNNHPSGVECIDIIRHYCFDVGNAIKYLWRAGLKSDAAMTDRAKEIEDLEKAKWYIEDRIKQLRDETIHS